MRNIWRWETLKIVLWMRFCFRAWRNSCIPSQYLIVSWTIRVINHNRVVKAAHLHIVVKVTYTNKMILRDSLRTCFMHFIVPVDKLSHKLSLFTDPVKDINWNWKCAPSSSTPLRQGQSPNGVHTSARLDQNLRSKLWLYWNVPSSTIPLIFMVFTWFSFIFTSWFYFWYKRKHY